MAEEETGLEEDWNSLWRSMTKTLIAEGQRCGPLLCVCAFEKQVCNV